MFMKIWLRTNIFKDNEIYAHLLLVKYTNTTILGYQLFETNRIQYEQDLKKIIFTYLYLFIK